MPEKDGLPQLQSLVVFESAARLLSFTRAAKELGTTQPAISQQIRGLEANLGRQLFTRIYRGVELTEAGNKLLLATQKSLQSLKFVCDDIRQQPKKNQITVATDFAFAAYGLMPKLTEFRNLYQEQFPEMDIRLQTSQAPEVENSSDADIVIVFGADHYQAYDSCQLITEKVHPVCSQTLLNGQSIETLQDLLQLPLLKLNVPKGKRWLNWDDVANQYDLTLNGVQPQLESDNFTLLVQAALAGQGVCLAWSPLVDDLVDAGILVSFPQFSHTSSNAYHLVFTRSDGRTPLMQAFADWLSISMRQTKEI
jgi:putative choline sulfate-utilization transcription factor